MRNTLTTGQMRDMRKAGWRFSALSYGPPKPEFRVTHCYPPGVALPGLPLQPNPGDASENVYKCPAHKYTPRTGRRVLTGRQAQAQAAKGRLR
jgi:hypothetical protein